jgi:hypothetical protein
MKNPRSKGRSRQEQSFKTKTSITGLELKLFQNTLLVALGSFCPKLREDFSVMLDIVEDRVQNEIRAARPLLPTKPSKNGVLFSLMKAISKCSQAFTHNFQHEREQARRKANVVLENPLSLKSYFIREGKRLARMSQKDVVPSVSNIVKLYGLILKKVEKNCLQSQFNLQSESHRTGSLLLSIISELMKDISNSRRPTAHQHEMEKLIDAAETCGVEK